MVDRPGANVPVFVDLGPHFNGTGISSVNRWSDASLGYMAGGVNTALPAEDLPESGSVVEAGEAVFLFPSKEPGALNTLEPEGQLIPVPAGRYSRLHILGSCLGTAYREQIGLATDRGPVPLPFTMSHMFSAKPASGEVRAVETRGILTHPKGLVTAYKPVLWAGTFPFSEPLVVHALELPFNPNMRILALTLE